MFLLKKRSILLSLKNFIVPPLCPVCMRAIQTQLPHSLLCQQCWQDIIFIQKPFCEITGIPLPFDEGDGTLSALALARPPIYDKARFVGLYEGHMRTLVHRLKYGDKTDAIDMFGRWLVMAGEDILNETDILVPVPLHWQRLLFRRFNQAVLLANTTTKYAHIPTSPVLLKRTRATRTQVGMTRGQRQHNVRGAFVVEKKLLHLIKNKNVALIDDVMTTGSTADACAKTLKTAGANKVFILALARVYNPVHSGYDPSFSYK